MFPRWVNRPYYSSWKIKSESALGEKGKGKQDINTTAWSVWPDQPDGNSCSGARIQKRSQIFLAFLQSPHPTTITMARWWWPVRLWWRWMSWWWSAHWPVSMRPWFSRDVQFSDSAGNAGNCTMLQRWPYTSLVAVAGHRLWMACNHRSWPLLLQPGRYQHPGRSFKKKKERYQNISIWMYSFVHSESKDCCTTGAR